MIAKDMDEDLVLEGTALVLNQRVSVFVGSWEWGAKADFSNDDVGAVKIEMTAKDKIDLTLGIATVFMN